MALADISFFIRAKYLDSALYYGKLGVDLSDQISYDVGLITNYRMIAIYFRNIGNLDSAYHYTRKSQDLAKEIGHSFGVSAGYNELAAIYSGKGQYAEALKSYLSGLRIDIQEGRKHPASVKNINIGALYANNEMWTKALIHLEESIKLSREIGRLDLTSSALRAKSYVLRHQKKYREALVAAREAMRINNQQFNYCKNAMTFRELSQAHLGLQNYDSARYYAGKGLRLAKECDNRDQLTENLINHSIIAYRDGNWRLAIDQLRQVYTLSKKDGYKPSVEESAKELYTIYKAIDRQDSTLYFLEEYTQTRDSIHSGQVLQNLAIQQVEFEMEAFRREEAAKQEIERLEQAFIRNALIGGLAVTGLIAFLIFNGAQRRKKAYKLLKELNDEIVEQKEELSHQSEELIVLNDSLNSLNSLLEEKVEERTQEVIEKNKKIMDYAFMNAHKLRAPLSNILGLVAILDEHKSDPEEKADIIKMVKESSVELDNIVREIQKAL